MTETEQHTVETVGANDPVRIDSREIAFLTRKNHADVCRDIRRMLEDLEVPESKFASGYKDAKGERRRCYLLPWHELMLLLSGYSTALRDKVLKRWEELEARTRSTSTPKGTELIALAVIEAQRVIGELHGQIHALEPRALVADHIASALGLKTLSEVGKINGLGPHRIFQVLADAGVIFRTGNGPWIPYQEHVEAGRFVVKERTFQDREGNDHLHSQLYVTGKGEVWIASRFCTVELEA